MLGLRPSWDGELFKNMKTLFELAEDFIYVYVKRGETIGQLQSGRLGSYMGDKSAQIGFYDNGKFYSDKIKVMRNKEVAIFSLKDVYDSVKEKLNQLTLKI